MGWRECPNECRDGLQLGAIRLLYDFRFPPYDSPSGDRMPLPMRDFEAEPSEKKFPRQIDLNLDP